MGDGAILFNLLDFVLTWYNNNDFFPMFDHLETKTIRPLEPHHHVTLWVLMTSCLMLLLTFFVPLSFLWQNSQVVSAAVPVVRLWPDSEAAKPRVVVGPITNLELAAFVMQVEETEVQLEAIGVTLDGVYSPADISSGKFYLDNIQVGHDVEINAEGRYVFTFDVLSVPVGMHTISIRTDWNSQASDRTLIATLGGVGDMRITANDQTIKVSSVFPQTAGQITFADKGSLRWLAQSLESKQLTGEGDQVDIFIPLQVQSEGEIVDIRKIVWAYQTTNMRPQKLEFLVAGKVVQTWDTSAAEDNLEVVIPDGRLLVGSQVMTDSGWRFRVLPLRPGAELGISALHVTGQGYTSGREITFNQSRTPSVFLLNEKPTFALSDLANKQYYTLTVNTVTGQPIEIENLYLTVVSDYPLTKDWTVEVNGNSVPRTVSLAGGNGIRFLFKGRLTLQDGDIIRFKPEAARVDYKDEIDIVMQTDTLQLYSDSSAWYASGSPEITPAGATRILIP